MSEHETARQKLAMLATGALSPDEEICIRAHLAACRACAREEQVWRGLLRALARVPETIPAPGRLARIAALAQARREEVLAKRWNRLVLVGLALYGWTWFLLTWPLLSTMGDWLAGRLALPAFAVALVGAGLWWLFCWVIGLALLPLLRGQKVDVKENVI